MFGAPDIKAVYRCKLCGKRVYQSTAMSSTRQLDYALKMIMDKQTDEYDYVPDEIVHNCDENKAGIAKLIGLKKFD